MRSVVYLLVCFFALLPHWASCQVMGYGAEGMDGYGTQSTAARTAKLPKDTAYHTLDPNEIWSRQPWKDSVYTLPDFDYGRLEFSDGTTQTGKWKMNYSFFLNNIAVLLDTRDVVGLARYPGLEAIHIGKHKFYNDSKFGFIEIVQEGTIKVAKKRMMHCIIENSSGFKRFPLINEDPRGALSPDRRYYWPYDAYFIIAPGGESFRANPFILRQLIPHLKAKLKIYGDINDINFRNLDDIKKIVEYSNQHYSDPGAPGDDDIIRLDESESIEHSKWKDLIYLFPSFESPTMTMQDGSRVNPEIKVNYNMLTGRMNSLNKKGDTVLFTTSSNRVVTMTVDDLTFFNDPIEGFMETIVLSKLGLGRKPLLDFLGRYDVSVTDTITRREKRYVLRYKYYFILKNKAIEANERNIAALFPNKHVDEIEEYILVNHVNFGSKEELLKLIAFCQQLRRAE